MSDLKPEANSPRQAVESLLAVLRRDFPEAFAAVRPKHFSGSRHGWNQFLGGWGIHHRIVNYGLSRRC